MSAPVYSQKALAVRSKFTKRLIHCFVEWEEDKVFWSTVMTFYNKNFLLRFHMAGDCGAVDNIIDLIINGDENKMAIRDSDYLEIISSKIDHPRIIYTFGYSVENSIYNAKNLTRAIECLALGDRITIKEVEDWLKDCADKLEDLIILDIADITLSRGVGPLGDSSVGFVAHHKDYEIDEHIVNQKLAQYSHLFSQSEIDSAKLKYNKYRKRKYLLIRGHFLNHITVNFINRKIDTIRPQGKKAKVNYTSIFAQLVGQLSLANLDESESRYISRKIEQINSEVV